jgi:L-threonylcarbamoyladenylate synthase
MSNAPHGAGPPLASRDDLAAAVRWLQRGGVVVMATDTVYGLAVDPRSVAAVRALFALKGRRATEALPLVAASRAQVEAWCGPLSPVTGRLADRLWPGPLSLIVDAPPDTPAVVHGGRGTLAVRVPSHAVTRDLCEAWGGLLTATSANRSGSPPATCMRELGDLARDPRLFLLDAGTLVGGPPSTIVDARGAVPVLVRAGAIAWDRVLESLQA